MFAKGPRFNKQTVSEIPGPGEYNPQEPDFNSHKRGAFLEKAERFTDTPAEENEMNRNPQSSAAAHKPGARSVSAGDRYALLQRKVDDLERVHQEGKRAHLAEVERLKAELAKYQKQHMDNAELIEKQKKQNALLEARVQELKRTTSTEGTELKEMRTKLRSLENERNRLQANESEVQTLKASLQSLESKRRDELRERDSRIAALEKELAEEKHARETALAQNLQLKKASEVDSRLATKKLQTLVDQKTEEASKLRQDIAHLQDTARHKEEELLEQLEQHKNLLSQVAAQYGRLATEPVRRTLLEEAETGRLRAEVRALKLERRLANSEAQVAELVHLIRQVQTTNHFLLHELRDTSEQLALVEDDTYASSAEATSDTISLLTEQLAWCQDELNATQLGARTTELLSIFYNLYATQIAAAAYLLRGELEVTDLIADRTASQLTETLASHDAIAIRLESVGKDYASAQEQVGREIAEKHALEREVHCLTSKLEEKEAGLKDLEKKHQEALRKERDSTQRVRTAAQHAHMAEDALRDEIAALTKEVQELEPYAEAYSTLLNQIALLRSRQEIAEEQANQLSQCNAELLGHHNPAQRILYVDRIRRELAEARQTIAELQLDKENALLEGDRLAKELAMYTSVVVPVTNKPRTNLTRVTRAPLTNLTGGNLNAGSTGRDRGASVSVATDKLPSPGDMTVDELM